MKKILKQWIIKLSLKPHKLYADFDVEYGDKEERYGSYTMVVYDDHGYIRMNYDFGDIKELKLKWWFKSYLPDLLK